MSLERENGRECKWMGGEEQIGAGRAGKEGKGGQRGAEGGAEGGPPRGLTQLKRGKQDELWSYEIMKMEWETERRVLWPLGRVWVGQGRAGVEEEARAPRQRPERRPATQP